MAEVQSIPSYSTSAILFTMVSSSLITTVLDDGEVICSAMNDAASTSRCFKQYKELASDAF